MDGDRNNFYNKDGKMIYYTLELGGKLCVYSFDGAILGWCAGGYTYNSNGIMIAMGETPGVLVKDFC